MRVRSCLLGLMLVAVFTLSTAWAGDVRLGVNAPRGEVAAKVQWDPVAKLLSEKTGQNFVTQPIKVADLIQVAGDAKLEFVVANPTQGVNLMEKYGATPLLSLDNKQGKMFAGVIAARKGGPVATVEDIRGKKVISLDASSTGAYFFQAYYLKEKGIDLKTDVTHLVAKKQDDALLAVKSGAADVALVRTGIMESMAKEGKLSMDDFVIIDAKQSPDFNLVHSTPLYPEWYIFVMPNAAPDLADKVREALVGLKAGDPVLQAAEIKGFIAPLSIDGYVSGMKALGMPPFN